MALNQSQAIPVSRRISCLIRNFIPYSPLAIVILKHFTQLFFKSNIASLNRAISHSNIINVYIKLFRFSCSSGSEISHWICDAFNVNCLFFKHKYQLKKQNKKTQQNTAVHALADFFL